MLITANITGGGSVDTDDENMFTVGNASPSSGIRGANFTQWTKKRDEL
jgi:hypothetical protein